MSADMLDLGHAVIHVMGCIALACVLIAMLFGIVMALKSGIDYLRRDHALESHLIEPSPDEEDSSLKNDLRLCQSCRHFEASIDDEPCRTCVQDESLGLWEPSDEDEKADPSRDAEAERMT
jgi:hypothetical protein